MDVARCTLVDLAPWVDLREALWPEAGRAEHLNEAAALLQVRDGRAIALLARADDGAPAGFAEARLRFDYVNGCETTPVAFLEGLYVSPGWRRRGVARSLCTAVAMWATRLGCSELASDSRLANLEGQAAHRGLGFAETERVVFFRKLLTV